MNRVKDNEHKKKIEELNEKEKKIEDFKQQKMNVMLSKKEMTNEINKQKEIIVQKFEKVMKNKRNKSIEPKVIKELFPEDESFYLRIKKMTEQLINSNKNSSSQTRYNSSIMTDRVEKKERIVLEVPEKKETPKEDNYKEVIDEKEIERRVEEYKNQLLKEINTIIEEEKEKEKIRTDKYEHENNQEEKVKLEKEMAIERQQGNSKISEMQK